MSRVVDEHLKRMNTTGIEWEDMTEEQQIELREKWNAVVSVPANLDCTCANVGCRNNRNCRNCMALHRYYDCLTNCFRDIAEEMQEGVPQKDRFDMHTKMQSSGAEFEGVELTDDPDESRARLTQASTPETMRKTLAIWDAVVRVPKNTACTCSKTDCWYHGNCVKCAALHRYYKGFPQCVRYIADEIEAAADAYHQK
ncbi:MAG: hypothetical protein FWH33_00930 [Oscillospiraceae bacterium]|nr:hypothetical protein [Oscillospiraceae bacterium]